MLLTIMIVCAVGAILLFSHEAFEDLYDAWSHPDDRQKHDPHHPKSGLR